MYSEETHCRAADLISWWILLRFTEKKKNLHHPPYKFSTKIELWCSSALIYQRMSHLFCATQPMGPDSSGAKLPASDRLCILNTSPNTTTKLLLLLQGNTPTMFSSWYTTDVEDDSSSSPAAILVLIPTCTGAQASWLKGGGALQVSPPHANRTPPTVGTLCRQKVWPIQGVAYRQNGARFYFISGIALRRCGSILNKKV